MRVRRTFVGASSKSLPATAIACLIALALTHLLLSSVTAVFGGTGSITTQRAAAGARRSAHVGNSGADAAVVAASTGSATTVFRSAPTVLAGVPYRPTHRGWSDKVFPVAGGGAGGAADTECVAWRQTGLCRADGPREAFFDVQCQSVVRSGRSGYCQCGGNTHKAKVNCEQYAPFTCADACAGLVDPAVKISGGGGAGGIGAGGVDPQLVDADGTSLVSDIAAAEAKIKANGHIYVAGRKILALEPPRELVEAELKRRMAAEARSGLSGSSPALRGGRRSRLLAAQRYVAPDPASPAAREPMCRHFQQTSGCTPHGPPERGHRRSCDDIVPSGVSGYCVCGRGYKGPGVGCDHPAFTCHDGCDPTLAHNMDEVLHGSDRVGAVRQQHDDAAASGQRPTDAEREAALRAEVERDVLKRWREILDDQVSYGTPAERRTRAAGSRILDRAPLTDEERREAARFRAQRVAREAEIERADTARRTGDWGPTMQFVAGGGPAILADHAAFDRDVAERIAEAARHAEERRKLEAEQHAQQRRGPAAASPLHDGRHFDDSGSDDDQGGDNSADNDDDDRDGRNAVAAPLENIAADDSGRSRWRNGRELQQVRERSPAANQLSVTTRSVASSLQLAVPDRSHVN